MNNFLLTIQGKQRAYSGPSAWSEVTPRQAVVLVRFRGRIHHSLEIVFPLLQLLYGIKPSLQRWLFDESFLRRKKIPDGNRLTALANGQALIDTLTWIWETGPGSAFLVPRFKLYDFQFGTVRVLTGRLVHQTVYHGPAEALSNCTFGEFFCAENAYLAGDLPQLAAVLFRPAGTVGKADVRQTFDKWDVDARAAKFSELDPALLELIKLQYEACQKELHPCFPRVFVPKEVDEKAPLTGKPRAPWMEIAIKMAKHDPTKVGEIENVNLYLALKTLDEQIREADELEQQLTDTGKK